jgi:two-component system CheB/CheR fusion protein
MASKRKREADRRREKRNKKGLKRPAKAAPPELADGPAADVGDELRNVDGNSAVEVDPSAQPAPKPASFPVVGIGASAGGLAALEEFFENVPEDSGMAYVVVTHQAPGRATLLPELLQRRTKLPVTSAADGMRLELNHAYIAPPGTCLSVDDEHLQVEPQDGNPRVLPIDQFFRSIAYTEGENAIAIMLSGNGSDGAIGITAVKGAAGLVMAQDPKSAQYPGMPASAIATQLVDYVLRPSEMPERLVRYVRGRARLPAPPLDQNDEDVRVALQRVLVILRNRTGSDFTAYKKSTIGRRIERRMTVHGISNLGDYARFLEQAPFEVDALFKELLISVTAFFRDPSAFESLEHELVRLTEMKGDDSPLRAWVPACSTGEEAYSLAILIKEVMQRTGRDFKVQIFATDLDPHAIELARGGHYSEGIAADVSPERLQRFFTKDDSGYRVNKDVREMLVFAVQNAIKDPPFTKLDLVSCRNLLIYLEQELQRRLLILFGYALLPGGVLMLGTSESVSGFDDRFAVLDKRWKLFQRRQSGSVVLPDLAGDMPAAATIRGITHAPRDPTRANTGVGVVA